ncbi:MAG: hypothetical protein ABSD41_02340 [Candidatus Bathyarchaeia archaeon]|jgi:hypothetical protein
MQSRKSVEDLLSDFEELFATARSGSSAFSKNIEGVRGFGTKNGMLNLNLKAHESLKKIVDELQKTELGNSFSRTFIKKRVDSTLAEIVAARSDQLKAVISKQVRDLVDSLSKTAVEEYAITVPVSGVTVWPHSRVFKVGRCSIYSLANFKEARWLGMIQNGISELLKSKSKPPGGSEHWIKTIVRSAPEDSEKREEIANEQIHESLAVLMLYSILERNAKIFWAKLPIIQVGERKTSFYNAYVIETEKPFWAGEHVASSALPELVLNDKTMDSFCKFNFDKLDNLLSHTATTEVEKAICRSLPVMYSSLSSPELAWKYIGLVTALEMLLTSRKERTIKRNISERLAWLLGETPEDRRIIMKQMEGIYSSRSDIIHEAEKTESLTAEVLQLHSYILELIARLLDGDFKQTSEIRDWVRSKQLGF